MNRKISKKALKSVESLTSTISEVIEKNKLMKEELERKKKETMKSITGNLNDSEVVNEAAKDAIMESLKFV